MLAAAVVALLLTAEVHAEVIKPVDVRSTSQFALGLNIENLINGDSGPAVGLPHFGLKPTGGPGVLDDVHGITVGGSADQWGWISGCADGGIEGGDPGVDCGGNPFAVNPVDEQIVEFEFNGAYDLSQLHIWNDNEDGFAPDRGVNEFEIQVSSDRTGSNFTAIGTTYNLTADSGFDDNSAQVISLVASGVRRVRLLINSNHRSAEAYVGLAEVRFEGTLVDFDLAADADKDGVTGGGDFLIWQRSVGIGEIETTFNTTLTATQREGDYDNNNVVNYSDYPVWEGEFGQVASNGQVASTLVPEPVTLTLGIMLTLSGLLWRRRCSRMTQTCLATG
jgi:hypothetical protein